MWHTLLFALRLCLFIHETTNKHAHRLVYTWSRLPFLSKYYLKTLNLNSTTWAEDQIANLIAGSGAKFILPLPRHTKVQWSHKSHWWKIFFLKPLRKKKKKAGLMYLKSLLLPDLFWGRQYLVRLSPIQLFSWSKKEGSICKLLSDDFNYLTQISYLVILCWSFSLTDQLQFIVSSQL